MGEKPDGHHTRPLVFGVPEDSPLKPLADPAKFFINWHPGTLRARDDGPPGRFCCAESGAIRPRGSGSGEACRPSSSLPDPYCLRQVAPSVSLLRGPRSARKVPYRKHESPDIGDWLDNSTQTQWRDRCATESGKNEKGSAPRPRRSAPRHPAGQGCWHYTRSCSYYDQKRAFTGTSSDGPLTIKVPRGACNLFLSEPGYEWSKPIGVANWHHELSIKIDGEQCRACSIVQGSRAVHPERARRPSEALRFC